MNNSQYQEFSKEIIKNKKAFNHSFSFGSNVLFLHNFFNKHNIDDDKDKNKFILKYLRDFFIRLSQDNKAIYFYSDEKEISLLPHLTNNNYIVIDENFFKDKEKSIRFLVYISQNLNMSGFLSLLTKSFFNNDKTDSLHKILLNLPIGCFLFLIDLDKDFLFFKIDSKREGFIAFLNDYLLKKGYSISHEEFLKNKDSKEFQYLITLKREYSFKNVSF